jgi:hypothetical protein
LKSGLIAADEIRSRGDVPGSKFGSKEAQTLLLRRGTAET